MMSAFRSRPRRFAAVVDSLEGRSLLSAGVTVSLANRVLSIEGTSASAPITVDMLSTTNRKSPGTVVVEGAAALPRGRVKSIQITGMEGEAIVVNRDPHHPDIPVNVQTIGGEAVPNPDPNPQVPGAPPAPAPGAYTVSSTSPGIMSPLEQQVVDLTNQARAQNGLPPLQVSSALVTAAQIHSGDMAQMNSLEHDLSGVADPTPESRAAAVGYNYSWLGENIAFNYPDAPSVVNAWMNSPDHRANILDPNFTQIGVAIAWNNLGQAYDTEEFGTPQ